MDNLGKKNFRAIRIILENLLKKLRVLNNEIDLLYNYGKLEKKDIVYKLNLNLLIENLDAYLIYMLRQIFRILGSEEIK